MAEGDPMWLIPRERNRERNEDLVPMTDFPAEVTALAHGLGAVDSGR